MLARSAMSRSNSTESISSTGSRASGPSTGVRTPGRPKTSSTFRSARNVSGTRTVKATPSRPVTAQRPGLGSRGYSDLGKLHSFFSQSLSNNTLIIFFLGPGSTAKLKIYPGVKTFTPSKKFSNIESRYSQKNLTPGRKPTVSQPGSRSSSPPHSISSRDQTQRKRSTPSRIPRSAAASREASPEDTDRFNR